MTRLAVFAMAVCAVFGTLVVLGAEVQVQVQAMGAVASTTYYSILPSPRPSSTIFDESKASITAKPRPDPQRVPKTEAKLRADPQAEPEDYETESQAKHKAEADPEPEPASEAEPDPEADPEAEAEADPESEHEAAPETDPEHEAVPMSEPRPHWKSAIRQWGVAWQMHIYILPVAYTVLAAWSLSLLVRRKRCAFQKRYYSIIQLFMLLASVMRAIYLFVDPYGSSGYAPKVLLTLLYGFPWSLLSISFSILFMALVDLSRVSLATLGSKVLTWKTVSIIGVAQLTLNMIADTFLALRIAHYIMALICHGTLILWSIVVFIGYWYVGKKIISTVRESYYSTDRIIRKGPQLEKSNSFTNVYILQHENGLALADDAKSILLRVVTIAYGSSIAGLLLAVVHVYDLLVSTGCTNETKDGYADPWAWWARQSCLHVVEMVLSSLLLYATTDPRRPTLLCTVIKRLQQLRGMAGTAVCHECPPVRVKGPQGVLSLPEGEDSRRAIPTSENGHCSQEKVTSCKHHTV